MSKLINKIKKKLTQAEHSVAYGMKGADDVISKKASFGSSDTAIVQTQVIDNIYNDLLRGEETQRVKETRDEFYRTLQASENLIVDVHVDGGDIDDEGNENVTLSGMVRKKTPLDFVCKIKTFNPENLPLKCIQDNIIVPEKSVFSSNNMLTSSKHVSVFKIKREGFTPRFKIEDYANKLVIRNIDDKTSYLDFYISKYASQFGFTYTEGKDGKPEIKKDNSSLLISELTRLMKKEIRTSDVVEIKELVFDTEKAYGVPNPSHFEFNNISFISINIFDGNFVITLKANNVVNGLSAVEKYHTDELDEKLKNHAVREGKTVDLFTAMRNTKNLDENKE